MSKFCGKEHFWRNCMKLALELGTFGSGRLRGARGYRDRARLRRERSRALPPILYKPLYIPIFIFTRTHTYLTFFPFHVVYSTYVARRRCACVPPPFEPNGTNAPLFYLRVFRKGKAFIPFLSTIRSVVVSNTLNTGEIFRFDLWVSFLRVIFCWLECFINFNPLGLLVCEWETKTT